MVLHCVRRKYSRDSRIESAAEQRRDACLFELLSISPLPAVLELSGILGLVIGGIDVVRLRKARVHYLKILIRKSKIENHVGLISVYKFDKLVNAVGVDFSRSYLGLGRRLEFRLQRVALRHRSRRYTYLFEHVAVLTTLVYSNGSNSAASDY